VRRTIWRKIVIVAAAAVITMSYAPGSFAQTAGQSGDRAREAQIKVLKGKIDNLHAQLGKLESVQRGHAASPGAAPAKDAKECCAGGASSNGSGKMGSNVNPPEGLAQAAPASEPSPGTGSEHPMGGEMGGGGMGGSMEHGGGMMGGSPAASPGAMPMEEHMKGMEHMHGMMHGGDSEASPAASPAGMPMEHNMGGKMGEGMGGMGGGGMGGGGMQGETGGGAQPEASPSAAMGG
jgi:hypothetical protein